MTCLGVSLSEQLQRFRQTHELCHVPLDGMRWEYLRGGRGSTTIVLLPGGGGGPEDMFTLMTDLFRVISIGCPIQVTAVDQAARGTEAVLDAESVAVVCILGHSLGGMFAERFMVAHPGRVQSMVLANVAHYTPLRAAQATHTRSARRAGGFVQTA